MGRTKRINGLGNSSLAAGGSGVSLVGFAHTLPPSYHIFAQILVYLSPVASLVLRECYSFGAGEAARWWGVRQSRKEIAARQKDLAYARDQRIAIMNDPHATQNEKDLADAFCEKATRLIANIDRLPR